MARKWMNFTAALLMVIGAINWGTVGLLDYNFVEALLGAGTMLTKTVYVLVGVAGILAAVKLMKKD